MERCKKCHRIIKNPKSVTNGYGPTCWKKVEATIPKPQTKIDVFFK